MPTHDLGQGYSYLNFLIPELFDRITFRKGPYYAEEGDFSSAGAAHIDYFRRLDRSLAQLTLGRNGYARSLLAGSPRIASGNLLYGLELFHNDGPWVIEENYRKFNGVLRYSQGTRSDGFSLTGMAYRGNWTSTDQVPQRAIQNRRVGRFRTAGPNTCGANPLVPKTIPISLRWRNFGVFGMACFRPRQDLARAAVISCRCCKTASVSIFG